MCGLGLGCVCVGGGLSPETRVPPSRPQILYLHAVCEEIGQIMGWQLSFSGMLTVHQRVHCE